MATWLLLPLFAACLAVAVVVSALRKLRWKQALAKALPGLPYLPPSYPFGNLDLIQKFGLKGAYELVSRLAPVAGFWFFGSQWIVVRHHEDVKTVFNSTVHRNSHPSLERHNQVMLGRKATIYLMNDEWRAHRSAMTKAFHVVDLKNMTSDFVAVAMKLCTYLDTIADGNTVIDMTTTLKAATLDVIGLTSFGYDFRAVDGLHRGVTPPPAEAFQFLLAELTRRVYSGNPLLSMYWLPTEANRKVAANRALLRGLIDDIVTKRVSRMKANPDGEHHEDLLLHMIRAFDQDASGLITEESLTDSLLMLMFGGYDTTSLALSFSLWLTHTHPATLTKLQAEMDAKLPSDPLDVTTSVVGSLAYTRAVFEETMRLYPPVPITYRAVTSPLTLSTGVTLPVGFDVVLPMHVIHRDPHNWPDQPDAFKPERFLNTGDESAHSRHPAAAFTPFSMGRRDCVGRNFAMLEGPTLLALLHQRFTFTPVPGYTLEAEMQGMVQGPKGGLPVTVKRRPSL